MSEPVGVYGPDSEIVDYILGITFEIWEQRGLHLINQYYAPDCIIYSLDGVVRGAQAVVEGTRAMLESYPDRVLLAEAVIWSAEANGDYYSSHRILSEMTNIGPTPFGPATGRQVRIRNIADCVVREGQVVEEWLVRDNLALVQQLGGDPLAAAKTLAQGHKPALQDWLRAEHQRLHALPPEHLPEDLPGRLPNAPPHPAEQPEVFARFALNALWAGDFDAASTCYAPYAVLHRNPRRRYSGASSIMAQYQQMREQFAPAHFSVDHVASQPFSANGVDIAVRWTMSGEHQGSLNGLDATGHPLLLLGVTHLHCVNGRIAEESTVFDELAVMAQALAPLASV